MIENEAIEKIDEVEVVDEVEEIEKVDEIEATDEAADQDDREADVQPIAVGNIYTGKVIKIKPFGAIVSLPGSGPGLVHISQIAAGYIQSVEDVLEVGDEVNIRVLSIDAASGKISLSMKDIPQMTEYDEDDPDGYGFIPDAPVVTAAAAAAFEEKFKAWQKVSNERIAGLNKRNKRR
ncbi:MAG: S1 RNA-binding domain-containing protein [Defluviitaleaceae bacterium]|nr:S1 RNA-binding domain-containing protein [Defluviitaleaceae bacterium]